MPTIRERFATALLGPERARLDRATKLLLHAYEVGPWELTPEDLIARLREVDSSLLTDLVNQLGYDLVGTFGATLDSTDAERGRAVDQSRRLYKYDVITQWIVWLWTNFGFGENIQIVPNDDTAQETWTEFWKADRNAPLLAEDQLSFMSEDVLVDGEKFLVFFISTIDGKATLREIDTKEIVELVKHPDDDKVVLYYKRMWSTSTMTAREMYYPDWAAKLSGVLDEDYIDETGANKGTLRDAVIPKGGIVASEVNEKTDVLVLHIAHNIKGGDRGWPLMTAGAPWSRVHKKFREDRASVAASVAMYVNKLKVQGGSRAVDRMKSTLQSALTSSNLTETNPPAAAGSTWIENQSADLQRLNLGTGASDAKADGESLLLMAGLGGGVYPHWMGAGDAYRLATASSMESPMYREFSRYQKFWGAQFRKIVRIVLWGANEYDGQSFKDTTASVSTDKLLQTDVTQLVNAVTSVASNLLAPYAEKGSIPPETVQKLLPSLWELVLQTLGVSNADELAKEENFKPVEKEEETPPPQTPTVPEGEESPPVEELLSLISDARKEIAESLRDEDGMRQTINVNVPGPNGETSGLVTVHEEARPPVIHVHVPEQPAPVINLSIPEQATPQVTLVVPDNPPVVNVQPIQEIEPAPVSKAQKEKRRSSVRRDPTTGEITGTDSIVTYEYDPTTSGPKIAKKVERQTVVRDPRTGEVIGTDTEATYEYEE